mmetsp:Transcript_209/g.559  ORF Transcript_209/g.559 Transcript_209/m.559 type:complete len:369 (+) Transcript_209:2336-3442(+)
MKTAGRPTEPAPATTNESSSALALQWRLIWYQNPGIFTRRCGSEARMGFWLAVNSPETTNTFDPSPFSWPMFSAEAMSAFASSAESLLSYGGQQYGRFASLSSVEVNSLAASGPRASYSAWRRIACCEPKHIAKPWSRATARECVAVQGSQGRWPVMWNSMGSCLQFLAAQLTPFAKYSSMSTTFDASSGHRAESSRFPSATCLRCSKSPLATDGSPICRTITSTWRAFFPATSQTRPSAAIREMWSCQRRSWPWQTPFRKKTDFSSDAKHVGVPSASRTILASSPTPSTPAKCEPSYSGTARREKALSRNVSPDANAIPSPREEVWRRRGDEAATIRRRSTGSATETKRVTAWQCALLWHGRERARV